MKVLIVDDMLFVRRVLRNILQKRGFEVLEAENGVKCLELLTEKWSEIGVITLDREMPLMRGEEAARIIKLTEQWKDIPVIMISSLETKEDVKLGLEIGIHDYLIKPIDEDITYLKIKNAMMYYEALKKISIKELQLEKVNKELVDRNQKIEELNSYVFEKNKILEKIVAMRTKELNEMTYALITSLENASLYNDENTGNHIKRVSGYSEMIARECGLENDVVVAIKMYSSLHDIGKVAINPEILRKQGKLTPEEYDQMKQHVIIGYDMIKTSPLPNIAKNIIKYHHEKYNGSGYLEGLSGEAIPVEARIVAIADVFDALTTKRSYKEAMPMEKAIEIMVAERGKHFDPKLLDVFLDNKIRIMEFINNHKD